MYIPKQGDICYMDFAPTKGHEQTGKRPAIIINKDNYNKYTGLAVLCPFTTITKNFPTHYELLNTKKIKGSKIIVCWKNKKRRVRRNYWYYNGNNRNVIYSKIKLYDLLTSVINTKSWKSCKYVLV